MDGSGVVANGETNSVAAEYEGYSPRHVNDFITREDSRETPAEDLSLKPFLGSHDSGRKSSDQIFSLLSAIVCLILFVILLIGGTAAPCKFGLCGKIDRSSTLEQTNYDVQIYRFEAPFKFVWGAFIVFILSCAIFSLYSFVLCKKEIGGDALKQIAAYVRGAILSFWFKQLLLLAVVIVCLFILVGIGENMRSAGCLAIGAITGILLSITTAMVATAGNARAANLETQERSQKITVELRTATVITIASYSFAVGGPALSYLLFRDVRALSGYLIGAVTVVLFVRISGGIFQAASIVNNDPTAEGPSAYGSSRKNPTIFAENAGIVLGRATGEALHCFAAFTIAMVSTSILATSFPYFSDKFAMCVLNHIEIDHACMGFREPRMKLSFAATICRTDEFYLNYPLLPMLSSNSAFVAVPFILGFAGVLTTLISTAYRSTPKNADEVYKTEARGNGAGGYEAPPNLPGEDVVKLDNGLNKRMRPFASRVRTNAGIAALLALVCASAVCLGLFGDSSSFFKENNADRAAYVLPVETAENAGNRCRPLEASEDVDTVENNLAELPRLERVEQPFRTLDSFGDGFPAAAQTTWRLILCALLGVLLGIGLVLLHEYVVSVSRSPSRRVAENGEFGASAVLVEGLGVSLVATSGSFAVVLILVAGCYGLHGAYGIGISAMGMLSIGGPLLVMSLFDSVSASADKMTGVLNQKDKTMEEVDAFETVGKRFSAAWKAVVNVGLTLSLVCMIFVVIQESDLTPSARQLGGTTVIKPSRHVSDVDGASITEIYALVSTILGIVGPVVFCGALLQGMNRVWQHVLAGSRKIASEDCDYDGSVRTASLGSLVETVLPCGMGILTAIVIGFGFGRRALVGMLIGTVWMSHMVSQALCTGVGVWDSSARVAREERLGGETGYEKWRRAMSGGEGVGRALGEYVGPCVGLFAAEVCVMSAGVVGLLQADSSRWWIGLVIVIVFGLCGVGMLVWLNGRYDGVMKSMEEFFSVDRRGLSPFYESGPGLFREHISPESAFGALRVHTGDGTRE